MDRFALFLQNLRRLEEGLEALNQEFADLCREFDGEDFTNQPEYANSFNSLLESTTHGSASDIGFAREALVAYASYITFRKKYKYLSDSQLANVFDSNALSSKEKLALRTLFPSTDNQYLLATLATLRRDWNATFNNKSYSQVKAKLTF